jgi:hypothetical protein
MLILVQFPLVDARRFLSDKTGRLERPTWPTPLPFPDRPRRRIAAAAIPAPISNPAHPTLEHPAQKIEYDFIRSFGVVRQRKLGPITGWAGESLFCDLKNLLRFHRTPPEVAFRDTNGWTLKIRGAQRRFFTDGRAMGRFEVGFRLSWAAPAGAAAQQTPVVPPEGVAQIVRFVMEAPMSIADHYTARDFGDAKKKRPGRHELMIADLAPALSRAYLHASANDVPGSGNAQDHSWWVKVGNPVMFISFGQGELDRLPVSASALSMRRAAPAINAAAAGGQLADSNPVISLDEHSLTRDRETTRVWYIRQGNSTPASRDAARRARIHLMRFASESEGVTRIIRLIQLGKIPLTRSENDSDPSGLLQQYLADAITFLQRKVQSAMENDALFSSLIQSVESLPFNDVASLLQAVTEARASVRKQIESFVTNNYNNYNKYEGDHVEGDKVQGDKMQGDKVQGDKVQGDKQSIDASHGGMLTGVNQTKAGGDATVTASGQVTQMKQLFDELQKEVDKATAGVPAADKAAVQAKVDDFQTQVKKGKENRKWYDVSAKGLLDAVAAVGGIVAPIGAVVAKIVALVA